MSLADVQLHLVNDLDTANRMMAWMGERRDSMMAFDTETSGLSPEHDIVRLCQLGDAMQAWAVPYEQWGGVFMEALKKYEGDLAAFNLKYDVAMIRAQTGYTVPQNQCHDVRLMGHVIEPTYSSALKPTAARLVDPIAGGLQDQLGKGLSSGWTWATVPVDYEPYWTYGALDCILTSRLEGVQRPRLIEMGAMRAYELELAASWVCEKMERNGITIDRAFASEAYTQFKQHSQALSDWCKEHYDVRPSQNASVAQRLIAEGIPLDRTTGSGAVQLDKEVLGPIDHPLAQAVLAFRQYSKLASTYVKHFIEGTSEEDPRLHAKINTVGARTGRMSMSEPNLQNLPRRSESNQAAITVRNCFVPAPENTLLMIDYSQVELRLLAHLAGDEGLRTAFLDTSTDFFTGAARQIFQEPDFNKKDHRRQTTKNAFYAMGYGAGAAKFAATAGLSTADGQAMYAAIDAAYPGIRNLGRMVEAKAMSRLREEGIAYAKSPLTGRRHPIDDDGAYKLVNYLVQGTAAEVLKTKLIELDNAGFGPYLCLPVHDEVIFDVPADQVKEFASAAMKIMSDDQMFNVPLTVEASSGMRWGEKEDLDIHG